MSALRDFAVDAMQRLAVPGAAIGISTAEGREVLTLGVNALDTRFEIRSDMLFQIGSITKPMTATLIVALAEQGALDLDMPVATYVPTLELSSPDAARSVTLRQLLSHQGGFWGDWFDDFGMADDAIDSFVAEYRRLPQLFEPGTLWAYNNCGYILAGLAASKASGQVFEKALKTMVLEPLGMDHTVLSAAEAIAYPVAVGHTNDPEDGSAHIARQFLRPRARNPAGGVLASIEDVLTFAELHLGRRPGVLSAQSIRSMQEPQIEAVEANKAWGLGFAVENVGEHVLVGHGGATNGFRAGLEMVPEASFAVAVLTNSDSGSRFADEVVAWTLDDQLSIRRAEQQVHGVPASLAQKLVGVYEQPYASISVKEKQSALTGQVTTHSPYSEHHEPIVGERFGLDYIGEDRFVATDGELAGSQMKFWINPDGSVRFLQAGGRLYIPGSWSAIEGAHSRD